MAAPTAAELAQARIDSTNKATNASMVNASLQAASRFASDIIIGSMKNKTQQQYDAARIEQMKNDSALKRLTDAERLALDKAIASAVNDTAKLRIYEEAIAQTSVSSIESSASIYNEKIKAQAAVQSAALSQKKDNTKIYVLSGIGAVLIISTVILLKNK